MAEVADGAPRCDELGSPAVYIGDCVWCGKSLMHTELIVGPYYNVSHPGCERRR